MAQLQAAGEADRARAEAMAAQATRLQAELEATAMERDAARAAAEGPVRPALHLAPRSGVACLLLPAASA